MTMKKLLGISTLLLLMALIAAAPAWADDSYFWNVTSGTGYVDTPGNWILGLGPPLEHPGDDTNFDDLVYVGTPGHLLIDDTHTFAGQIMRFYIGTDDAGIYSGPGHVIQSGSDISLRHSFAVGSEAPAGSDSYYEMTGGSIVQVGGSSVTIGAKGSNGYMTMSGGTESVPTLFDMTSGTSFRVGYEKQCTGVFTMQDYSFADLGKYFYVGYGTTDIDHGTNSGTIYMEDHAQLTVASASDSYIGRYADATGKFEMIEDTIATITADDLFVGRDEGVGEFKMSGNAVATVAVQNLAFGQEGGTGTLTMSGSSSATFTGEHMYVARYESATGYLNLSGDAVATFDTGGYILYVADGGTSSGTATGTINLSGNATLNAKQVNVADSVYNQGTINVTDTADLITTGSIYVGVAGDATAIGNLNVTLNGKVNTNNKSLSIGRGGSLGTVTISDNAEVTVGNYVRLGDDGTAILNLDGGTLACDLIQTKCGTDSSPTVATFNFNGGTLKAIDSNEDFINLELDSESGVPEYATQTLNVKAGGAVIDTNTFDIGINQALVEDAVSTDGGLTKNGLGKLTLGGVNTYTGATLVNAGTLAVNGSIISNVTVLADGSIGGSGTITGDVDLSDPLGLGNPGGALAVDDTVAGVLDLLTIVGELDLTDGTIDFNSVESTLASGTYVFAEYGTLSGSPATTVGLLSGWTIEYAYGGNSIALLVTARIPGDANGDDKVDAADVSIMAANWGATGATWAMGDFSENGTVGPQDAKLLAQNWGTSGDESANAVPEPGTLALLVGLGMTFLMRRTRR